MTVWYGPFARLSDWWHGWRDGLANIPERPPRRPPPPTPAEPPRRYDVTTPHREYLIRMAQDGFDHERLRMEAGLVEAGKRMKSARSRAKHADQKLARAEAEYEAALAPLTEEEATRRRLAETNRDDSVVRARRETERRRHVASARRRLRSAQRGRDDAHAAVTAAEDEVARHRAVGRARVDRVHQHAQRRIAAYRRRLVISHPEGPWINRVLGVLDPHLPGWATEGAVEEHARPVQIEEPEPGAPGDLPPPWRRELGEHTTFGTGPGADVVIDVYGAKPKHFSLRRAPGGFILIAHTAENGPFINGRQVVRRTLLAPGDVFDFGNYGYRISDDGAWLERLPFEPGELVVHRLSASTKKTQRISEMSLVQRKNTVLAILGPSGAGKTSLFYALMNELKPAHGDFYYGKIDVRKSRAQMRTKVGFVPQDDDLHRNLTVERLLRYSDRLRRPGQRRAQDERINAVLNKLQIASHCQRRVGTLSGGQRKRVSIALELLARPPLLMLDEPTSGLDNSMDRDVMKLLSRYAAGISIDDESGGGSKTGERDPNMVIVITHATYHLEHAQQVLILATEGRPVFLGEPGQVLPTFGVGSYADLMKVLSADDQIERVRELATSYAEGPIAAMAADRIRELASQPAARAPDPVLLLLKSVGRFGRQLPVLIQRQIALMMARGSAKNRADRSWRDALFTPLIALLPFLVAIGGALIAAGVSRSGGLNSPTGAVGTLSLLITLGVLAGQALTYSDIVSEFPIIRREHRTGTLTAAVMVSKWLVFATAAVMQATLITLIFTQLKGVPKQSNQLPSAVELFVDLTAMTVAAMTLGMLISAFSNTVEQAVNWSTFLAIGQIALNGAAADLSHVGVAAVISYALPARWGLAAAASSIGLRQVSRGAPHDGLWRHTTGQWTMDLACLGMVTTILFALAMLRLGRRLDKPG